MNQTISDILGRRSVRAFGSELPKDEDLKDILEAGSSAAYGFMMKTRKLTLIKDPETLKKVNRAIGEALKSMPVTDQTPPPMLGLIKKAEDPNANFIYGAPAFIIVSTEGDTPSAAVDSTLSMANMMVAANALGLGTCWMNQLPMLTKSPRIRALMDELEIPADHLIFGTLALGYPAEGYQAPPNRKESDIKII